MLETAESHVELTHFFSLFRNMSRGQTKLQAERTLHHIQQPPAPTANKQDRYFINFDAKNFSLVGIICNTLKINT